MTNEYKMSAGNVQENCCGLENSRDEIGEQLSKIKIGYNRKNLKSDLGAVQNMNSDNELQSHSNIGAYMNSLNSIHSAANSRFSIILAGRLDSVEEDNAPHSDEQSLLNIAINESIENNDLNRSNNVELSRFLDSLEVSRKELASSELSERDSLEADTHCAVNKPGNVNAQNDLLDNDENTNPNSLKSIKRGQPKVISNKTFCHPVKIIEKSAKKPLAPAKNRQGKFLEPGSKYRSDTAEGSSNPLEQTENGFHSLIPESERLIVADVKTPSAEGICCIEDRCESVPRIKVHADTFGSELLSDISNLSLLGCGNVEQNGKNAESQDSCRDKIFKKFSQQFAQEPTKFTERLLSLVEESFLGHTNTEDPDISGVNLSRLTEEFRKILKDYGKRIEDESMPEFGFGPSFNASTLSDSNLVAGHSATDETAPSPFRNFSKLGGGKKTYRKTPRRVFLQANKRTHCSTPNCANPTHKAKNNNSYCSDYRRGIDGTQDNTATFEFWENLCYETTPNRGSRHEVTPAEISGVISREDLIRKSDQQMAALDMSCPTELETEKEDRFQYNERNFQDDSSSMKQKSIEHLSPSLGIEEDESNTNQKHKRNEIARAVERRRKCLEEARKVFEFKQNSSSGTKNCGSLDKNESSIELDYQSGFINTLSACVNYLEHVKTLRSPRNTLQCILECSETSEYSEDKTVADSGSIKIVEAVILPGTSPAEYRIQTPKLSPRNANQITPTYLRGDATPKVSNDKSVFTSPKRCSQLSPCSRSPRTQSRNVSTRKIRSPASSGRGQSLRAVKPALHTQVPRTPSITPDIHKSGNKMSIESCRSGINFIPRCASHNKLKPPTNKPSTINVTDTKKINCVPKVILNNASPSCDSGKKSSLLNVFNENNGLDCQKKLQFSGSYTPEAKPKRFFYTPGKNLSHEKIKPKIKYFETPKEKPVQKKLPGNSPGSYRVNYNTVQSPVGLYIRGTDPNLMTNVRKKTNEYMLTPCFATPKSKSKIASPILASSPCMSPQRSESSRLKFQLTPARQKDQKQEDNLLNIALCENDLSSNIGSEIQSHSPFPKIFYKPAPTLKMVKDDRMLKRYPKCLEQGTEEKIIYRHEGRLKSTTESRVPNFPANDSTKDSMSCDSGDISLLHQRPVAKSNYLFKK